MSKKGKNGDIPTESYRHMDKRPHIPTEQRSGLVKDEDREAIPYAPESRSTEGPVLSWRRDPQLQAKETPATPLYIQEKIHPKAISNALLKQRDESQLALFADFNGIAEDAIFEWYQHQAKWSNRLIRGESCHVMASLIAKEQFAGKVQMIYFDPPYGISFKATMQARADKKESGAGTQNIPNEPTVIQTFRDTYKNGIHSYFDNIYRIISMGRELLTESGSFFMQIGSENVNRLALVLDEVFGPENRIEMIAFAKSGGSASRLLPNACDYLLWYSRDRKKCKYHPVYEPLSRAEKVEHMSSYASVELENGATRNLTAEEKSNPDKHLPEGARMFTRMRLESLGESANSGSEPFTWQAGTFECTPGYHWRVSHDGLKRLAEKDRLHAAESGGLRWKRYENEVPGKRINNIWEKTMAAGDKHYIVETAESVIERCLLMTTDPGDLILDPTCGSGTTAFVAEKWGRRWITLDASKVGISLARQRLVTGVHKYHLLQDSREGEEEEHKKQLAIKANTPKPKIRPPDEYGQNPAKGFVYERVPAVSAGILAYDQDAPATLLVNRSVQKRGVKRLSSAFTVESHSPHRVLRPEEALENEQNEDVRASLVDALEKSGIDLRDGQRLKLRDITPFAEPPITHMAMTDKGRAAIMIAPDDCTLPPEVINLGIERVQTMPTVPVLIAIAFAFEADSRCERSFSAGRLKVFKAQANQDIKIGNAMDDERHDAFVLIGEPSVKIEETPAGELTVEVEGYDTYNPVTGQIEEGSGEDVQCWMIDIEYDGNSFFAHRIHFPLGENDKQVKKFKQELGRHIDSTLWSSVTSLKSAPFPKPKSGRIAIRIITTTHTEMTAIREIKQ